MLCSTLLVLCRLFYIRFLVFFFFQAEDGIRDFCLSRGLGDVYKRQLYECLSSSWSEERGWEFCRFHSVHGGRRCFCTLPSAVRGSDSTRMNRRGILNDASCARQVRSSSSASSDSSAAM